MTGKTSSDLHWEFYCHEVIVYFRYEEKTREAAHQKLLSVCVSTCMIVCMRWQAENGEVGETFRVGGPESHGKHYCVWPNNSEAGAALSSHCIFLHCRDWKVKLHFPESLAAKWPRCCQSEEAKWDVGGKVLESEDLEGRGHAFALCQQASSLALADLPSGSSRFPPAMSAAAWFWNTPGLVGSFMTAQKAIAPPVACSTVRLCKSLLRAQPEVCFFTFPTNSISHLTPCNKFPSA